ncbi:hypothetical protein [Methylobacterium sp. WL120]|uniref:hypothetical protein n=1 Tax=Methylobacterium sp. WL120 TaxID=2603887 RepID=UPI001FED424C|nr:hypothetical protein [Methylobacterium sp. WL120]
MSDVLLQEAAVAIRAMGWKVEPTGDDLGLWLVDGKQLSDANFLALARLIGLLTSPETIQ